MTARSRFFQKYCNVKIIKDDDTESVCSSMTPSEKQVLNPEYLHEVSGNSKCRSWLKSNSLQDVDVDSPPRKRKTFGLVNYTPSSTNETDITSTSMGINKAGFKLPDPKRTTASETTIPEAVRPEVANLKRTTANPEAVRPEVANLKRTTASRTSTPEAVSSQVQIDETKGLKSQNHQELRIGLSRCKRRLDIDYKGSLEENKENTSKLSLHQLLSLKRLNDITTTNNKAPNKPVPEKENIKNVQPGVDTPENGQPVEKPTSDEKREKKKLEEKRAPNKPVPEKENIDIEQPEDDTPEIDQPLEKPTSDKKQAKKKLQGKSAPNEPVPENGKFENVQPGDDTPEIDQPVEEPTIDKKHATKKWEEKRENTSKLSPYQLLRQNTLMKNASILNGLGVTELTTPPTVKRREKKTREKTGKKVQKKTPITSERNREIPVRKAGGAARRLIKETVNSDESSSDDGDDSSSDSFNDCEELSDSASEEEQAESEEEQAASEEEQAASDESPEMRRKRHQTPDLNTGSEEAVDNPDTEIDWSDAEQEDRQEDDANTMTEGLTADNSTTKGKSAEKKKERKQLRDSGKRYVSRKGKVMAARKMKAPHTCKRKCHEKVPRQEGKKIFDEYWNQNSHNKRRAYVAARIERGEVQRKRSRKYVENRQKNHSYKYFLEINGKRVQVCRNTMMNTLGESDRFIRGVIENKSTSTSGITSDDRRGKKVPKHALCNTTKAAAVQRHIASFPAYVSHYCRAKTGDQRYLRSDLTVAEMYRLYQEDPENPKVSLSTYTKQFKLTGLKIHPPQTDGCDTCETLDISIKDAATEALQKSLETKKEMHLRKAEKAYELKKKAKAASKEDPTLRVIVVDLQQCLPTPHLKCKKIYYSRQLYVLNFTVLDCTTGLTHCYMWSEVEGNRGSNEICTCLLQYILEIVPDGVKKLTVFSDCCSGQNRNSTVSMMMFTALQEHPSLEEIHHIFLVPGHTFMPEVDGKHAVIERYKNRLEKINIPDEWYTAVEQAGKTDVKNFPDGKFKVTHVTSFYDIASLAKEELVRRKVCVDKEPFNYLETHWWKYCKSTIGMVLVKPSFCENAGFRVLSFLRKGVRSDRLRQLLPCLQKLPAYRPISEKKKKDLLNLLCYLSEEFHAFYQELPDSSTVQELLPDSPDMDEEEDDPVD